MGATMQTPRIAEEGDVFDEFLPLQAIEEWALAQNWITDRFEEDSLSVGIRSDMCGQLNLCFRWFDEVGILTCECAYTGLVFNESHFGVLYETVARINIQALLGSFNVNSEMNLLLFSSTMIAKVGGDLFLEEVEERVFDAIGICEHMYSVFVSVLYEKVAPKIALEVEGGKIYGTA